MQHGASEKVHLLISNLREATIINIEFEDSILLLFAVRVRKKTLRLLMVEFIDEAVCLIVYYSFVSDNLLYLAHQVVDQLELLLSRIFFAILCSKVVSAKSSALVVQKLT